MVKDHLYDDVVAWSSRIIFLDLVGLTAAQ
jgi:hypothetical protein